jgi:hypothetical protein
MPANNFLFYHNSNCLFSSFKKELEESKNKLDNYKNESTKTNENYESKIKEVKF